MIPKTIHYCWFGGNPKPKLAEKCIASWEKFCPDYEIIRWDESNFDVNCIDYTRFTSGKNLYAYLSDYARLWAVEKYGGHLNLEQEDTWFRMTALIPLP
jgi:mannosyltransferase OCH1-like enzyme